MTDREKALVRASMVSKAYREQVGVWGSYEEVLSDLLADLMHFVDELRLDREMGEGFDDLLGTARMNYEAEKEGSE